MSSSGRPTLFRKPEFGPNRFLFWFQVTVDKGINSKQKFYFYGDGDHEPGREPGDVIIQLEEKPHDLFQRHGKDITMKMDLTLVESLCGMKKTIKTLDNRHIVIATKPGEVVKPGDIKMIEGEGFPVHRDPFNKGRLIIIFNVIFPESLNESNAKKLIALLPKGPKDDVPKDGEHVNMEIFDGKGTWGGEEPEHNGMDEVNTVTLLSLNKDFIKFFKF